MNTERLHVADAYLKDCEATVTGINERGGLLLDRTVFYATGGGQPGDSGRLSAPDRAPVIIATTVHGDGNIVHVPAEAGPLPAEGDTVRAEIDWERRHRHMRVHTLLHLMLSLVPFPMTGGQIGTDGGRIDFDISDPDKVTKDGLTEALNRLIAEDHPVSERWISDEELLDRPDLVRTMSVKPPMGTGRVRLVQIGADGAVDLQPCGGTHVRSTKEIGPVEVTKMEKKGRLNRRIRVALL